MSATVTDPWAVHEQRVQHLLPHVLLRATEPDPHREFPWYVHDLLDGDPLLAGSLLLVTVRLTTANGPSADRSHGMDALVSALESCTPEWSVTAQEARLAARAWAEGEDGWSSRRSVDWVIGMLERTRAAGPDSTHENRAHEAAAKLVLRTLDSSWAIPRDRMPSLSRRLRALLPTDPAMLDLSMINEEDGWSRLVVPALRGLEVDPEVAGEVLECLTAARGSRPTKAWSERIRPLMRSRTGRTVVRIMVDAVARARPVTDPLKPHWAVVIHFRNDELIRAAAWAAAHIAEDWTVPALDLAADRSFALVWSAAGGGLASDKVPNACLLALGEIGSPDAIARLQRRLVATRHNGVRKRISAALATAAERSGLTPSQVVERAVETAGLDSSGALRIGDGESAGAEIRLGDDLKVTVTWLDGGVRSARPTVHDKPAQTLVKARAKQVRDLLASERRRLESLFTAEPSWPIGDWRRYYLDHPVTGPLTRGMIWRFEPDPSQNREDREDGGALASFAGIPGEDGVRTLAGRVPLPESGTVRLWHPATASTSEIEAWRRDLTGGSATRTGTAVQPFKQAFREVYLLTPAERETATFSLRFATHVVQYAQLFALFKERAWGANFLRRRDDLDDGRARRAFADAGLTAVFEHAGYTANPPGQNALAFTGRLWFHRTGDRAQRAVPLEEIPPLLFSETMRDLDLFVSVTSIALDPTWAQRRAERAFAYWSSAAEAELSESAAVRRDTLALLLPALKIADRLTLEGRYLRVRGRLHTYRIHLGSAGVLIEPDDRHLCIVPRRGPLPAPVRLPFDGDVVLSLVLSKALLLAADDRITDTSILQQLDRRPGPL